MIVQELSVTLSAQEWDIVGNALGQRPFVEVANIFTKMQAQLRSQQEKLPQAPLDPQASIAGI